MEWANTLEQFDFFPIRAPRISNCLNSKLFQLSLSVKLIIIINLIDFNVFCSITKHKKYNVILYFYLNLCLKLLFVSIYIEYKYTYMKIRKLFIKS